MRNFKFLFNVAVVTIAIFGIYSCSKEDVVTPTLESKSTETRSDPNRWCFTSTWYPSTKDCCSPIIDCGAFQCSTPVVGPQTALDGALNNLGTKSFFLSSQAGILFPGLGGETLQKLQSGNYSMFKFSNNGDDFYFVGTSNVSDTNYEFVLKLDK